MNSLHVVVLAAGHGKRMKSNLPKVLHPVMFRPMIHYVLDVAILLKPDALTVVVSPGAEAVREVCGSYAGVRFVEQAHAGGTGHAVQQVVPDLKQERVLVLCGDTPLLRASTLQSMMAQQSVATLLTARLPDPGSYGRVVRDEAGHVLAIRERVDCSQEETLVQEVNSGVYLFDAPVLTQALAGIKPHNKQGEFYLTDVVEQMVGRGLGVQAIVMDDVTEMTGINDRAAQAKAEALMRDRINGALLETGVSLQDPHQTWVDSLSRVGKDVRIESGVQIQNSRVADGVVIEAGCRLIECEIAEGARILQGSYLHQAKVGPRAQVGPYAHLRPGTVLGAKVRVGNFVEIKNASLGAETKAAHLSYVGDADIGQRVNLGCGFITCNYDGGGKKHRTVIEDDVFVGSDSQMVAPVQLGQGSYIGSGSTITQDVPEGALAISRAKQVNKPGYASRYIRGVKK